MLKNRLIYKTKPGSYVNDYDPTIDPSVLNSHATAAFRYFHSQIEGRLEYVQFGSALFKIYSLLFCVFLFLV